MKKNKIYLARDADGAYSLFSNKPSVCKSSKFSTFYWQGDLIVYGDSNMAEQLFGLKKHLRKKSSVSGTCTFKQNLPKKSPNEFKRMQDYLETELIC